MTCLKSYTSHCFLIFLVVVCSCELHEELDTPTHTTNFEENILIYDDLKTSYVELTLKAKSQKLLEEQLQLYQNISLDLLAKEDFETVREEQLKTENNSAKLQNNTSNRESIPALPNSIEPAVTIVFNRIHLDKKMKQLGYGIGFKSKDSSIQKGSTNFSSADGSLPIFLFYNPLFAFEDTLLVTVKFNSNDVNHILFYSFTSHPGYAYMNAAPNSKPPINNETRKSKSNIFYFNRGWSSFYDVNKTFSSISFAIGKRSPEPSLIFGQLYFYENW